jgi:hypothetical protein
MWKIVYFDEVKNDIREAIQWYKEQQERLDERFELSVKYAVSNIIKMPFAYVVRYKNIRIAHTKYFPYNIHFYIDEKLNQIVITGIIHNKRKDAIKLNRKDKTEDL